MLASRSTSELSSSSSALPQAIASFVGSALELLILSIEALRDRVAVIAPRDAEPGNPLAP